MRIAQDNRLVEMGRAIAEALNTAGRTQQWLADQLELNESQVSRMVNGKLPTLAVERVRMIEDLLGLSRGYLLRAAGYVAGFDTRQCLLSDPNLGEKDRDSLVRLYDTWVKPEDSTTTSVAANASKSRRAPMPPKRRRS